MTSFNNRLTTVNALWTSSTATTTQGTHAGITITPYLNSKHVIIDNQSGGNVTVCPENTTTGILLTPGDTFELTLEKNARFDLVNAGAGNVVMLWLF